MSESNTRQLARFAIDTDDSAIPAGAILHAKGAIADTIAVTLAGSREASSRIARQWTESTAATGTSRVLGTLLSTSPSEAAFANGVAAHALDFDDTHPHFSHPSATLVSALLPVGEAIGASGKSLIQA
jgi:2-methylcitrate dehydratase PrpD